MPQKSLSIRKLFMILAAMVLTLSFPKWGQGQKEEEAVAENIVEIDFFMEPFNVDDPWSSMCPENSSYPILQLPGVKIPDLTTYIPNITEIGSYFTLGVWAIYNEVNYTSLMSINGGWGVCTGESDTGRNPRSLRYLGNPNMDYPGLSLFQNTLPLGTEIYIDGFVTMETSFPAPNNVGFWALNGGENWTLYSEPDFSGKAACITPFRGVTYGWRCMEDYATVASVRVGCFSDFVVEHFTDHLEVNMSDSDGEVDDRLVGSIRQNFLV